MYRSDDDLRNLVNSNKHKVQIPTNLENISTFGDKSDKNRPIKFKINQKRVYEIYKYLLENNEY